MNPFLHVVAEANERRLYSQAKWFSNNFYIALGLRDSESQELFCRGQHTSVSFEFRLKCTIRYMGFTIVKTHISVQENNERISFSSRF